LCRFASNAPLTARTAAGTHREAGAHVYTHFKRIAACVASSAWRDEP
jgi:hypothetical protein